MACAAWQCRECVFHSRQNSRHCFTCGGSRRATMPPRISAEAAGPRSKAASTTASSRRACRSSNASAAAAAKSFACDRVCAILSHLF